MKGAKANGAYKTKLVIGSLLGVLYLIVGISHHNLR